MLVLRKVKASRGWRLEFTRTADILEIMQEIATGHPHVKAFG